MSATVTDTPAPAPVRTETAPAFAVDRRRVTHGVALLLALLGAVVVERADAGLGSWSSVIGLLSLVPLAVLGRVWNLPWWLLAGAASLPVSVLVVASTGELGAQGTARAATYGYGAFAFVALCSWASTRARRFGAAFGLSLVVLDQYAQAWLPWWGSGRSTKLMVGDFYWHNQLGIYCTAGAALAIVCATTRTGPLRLGAALVLAFATAGTIASASRASTLVLAAVWIVGLLVAVRVDGSRRGVLRWAVLAVASLAVTTLMTSPLLFPDTGSWIPGGALAHRMPGVMQDASTTDRLAFWESGIRVGLERPLTGHGLQTYGLYMSRYLPSGAGWSSNPHNEWVLGWAEGGIVGLLPLLAVAVGAVVVLVRSLRRIPSRSALVGDAGRWAGLLALGALVSHMAVDFDWEYPALVGLAGAVGALAASPLVRRSTAGTPRWQPVAAGALVVLLLGASFFGRSLDPRPWQPSIGYDAQQIARAQSGGLG